MKQITWSQREGRKKRSSERVYVLCVLFIWVLWYAIALIRLFIFTSLLETIKRKSQRSHYVFIYFVSFEHGRGDFLYPLDKGIFENTFLLCSGLKKKKKSTHIWTKSLSTWICICQLSRVIKKATATAPVAHSDASIQWGIVFTYACMSVVWHSSYFYLFF